MGYRREYASEKCPSIVSVIAVALTVSWSPVLAGAQARIADAKSFDARSHALRSARRRRQSRWTRVVKSTTLVLRFESIDIDTGLAQLRNGSVGSEVTVRLAEG